MSGEAINADRMKHLLRDPINRHLRQDPKPMTGFRILLIAGLRGFVVTRHYRNDGLRKHCKKLVKAGLLTRDRVMSCAAQDVFWPTPDAVPVLRDEGLIA